MIDVEKILQAALKAGATEAEVYRSLTREVTLRMTNKIESAKVVTTESIGIRVAVGKSVAVVGTQDLSPEGLRRAVEAAVSIARVTPEDPDWKGMNDKVMKTPINGLWDKATAAATAEDLASIAEVALNAVSQGSPESRPVRGMISATSGEIEIINTLGGPVIQKGTTASVYIYVKATDAGREGTYSEFDVSHTLRGLKAAEVAIEAGKRAPDFIRVSKIPTGDYDVILDPYVSSAVMLVMLMPALSALSVQQGRSPLAGKVGTQVLSNMINIDDVSTDPSLVSSREFDDEGFPTYDKPLIEEGILKGFVYDTYTARKEGKKSTGNAWRTYSTLPSPSPNYLMIRPGDAEVDEMIAEVRRGIMIMRTIGEWLSNPVSGSLNATITHAYLIENGEIKGTCKGGVLSGDFYEVFVNNVWMLGKEVRNFVRSSSPHILLRKVKVAGE